MRKSEKRAAFGDNAFDILRLYASIQVAYGHCVSHLGVRSYGFQKYLFGFQGVVVLFAISGYLIAASADKALNEGGGVGKYFRNRFLRIYPGLWACFTISTLCIFLFYRTLPTIREAVLYMTTQLSFLQFYTGGWLRGYGVGAPNGSLWTIAVELQFYVAILLLWPLLKKCGWKQFAAVILLLAGVNVCLGQWDAGRETVFYKLITCSLLPYAFLFLTGAFVYRYRETLLWYLKKWFWLFGLIYLLANYVLAPRLPYGSYCNVFSGFALSVFTLALAYGLGKIRLRWDLSYGIYLYHMVIVNVFVQVGFVGSYVSVALAMLLSVALAALSFFLVERPCMLAGKKEKRSNG